MKAGEVVIVTKPDEPPYPAIIHSIEPKLILVNTGGVIELLHPGTEGLNFSSPIDGTGEALKAAIRLREAETMNAYNNAIEPLRQALEQYQETRTFFGWIRSHFKKKK